MELKLHIQQTPQFNISQQQIHYAGANPQSLTVVVGGLPSGRQWQNYGSYIDVTDYVSDLYQLKLTWTTERDENGATIPGESQQKKSASGTLQLEGLAYTLIKQWLLDDVSAPLNSVSVKIEHVGCDTYEDYVIRSKDITWCDDLNKLCQFDVVLTQKDEALNCIKRTLITAKDGDRDWFPSNGQIPSGGKKHPRFSYCNEIRPNGMLIMLWWIGAVNGVMIMSVLIPLIIVINGVIAVIVAIIAVINFFINLFGGPNAPTINQPNFINPKDVLDSYSANYIESAGCGREHPAPLVRDYIYNVCKKCGIDTDSLPVTAPIFFSPTLTIETSGRGVVSQRNDYYNACYFNATVKRGIRRFDSLNIFTGPQSNATDFWIPDNSPLLTLDMFLDQLKGVFNGEWRVKNNKLYIQRKDYYINGGYVLDFTEYGADRDKLLEGVCFDWNETKYPAICKGIYTHDGVDTCGNEALQPMNGPFVFFGNTDLNPNFEGILDKTVQFGATKFRLDGASTDYIYDAMQVVVNGSVFTPFMMGIMRDFVAPKVAEYADYALLMKDETAAYPKLLIWDGQSYTNSRAIRLKCPVINPSDPLPLPMPVINQPYNNYPIPTPWGVRHQPKTFVIGSALTLGNSPYGYYKVQDFFGIQITKQPAILVNYPMYFEPGYEDTLWDLFHWIDDPLRKPKQNMSWVAKLELCCATLKGLDVFEKTTGIVLEQKVKLPTKWYPDGKIKEITVSYDPGDPLGQYIEIKGDV